MVKEFTESKILPVYAPIKGLAGHVPPTMLKPQYCAACQNMRFDSKEALTRTGYVQFGSARNAYPLSVYVYELVTGTRWLILLTNDGVYYSSASNWWKLAESLNPVNNTVGYTTVEHSMIYANGQETPKKVYALLTWTWGVISGTRDYMPQFVGSLGNRLILFGGYEDGSIIEIEDCEIIWDESSDGSTTPSLDEDDYQWGSGSAKFVIDNTIDDGDIIATEDVTSLSLTGCTHVRLCIKSTVDIASGDLHLLLDNHANCASPEEALNIGALAADDWTEVRLTLDDPTTLGAIISVGLKYTANSQACTIHVDAIRGVVPAYVPQRIRYPIVGDMTDWSGTGSGAFDAVDGGGTRIRAVVPLGDGIAVYKEFSISLLRHIGGKSIFRIDVLVEGVGLALRRTLTSLEGVHYFLGHDNIYAWDGNGRPVAIGDAIKDAVFPLLAGTYSSSSCFMMSSRAKNEVLLCMSDNSHTNTTIWTYNVKYKTWSKGVTTNLSGGGSGYALSSSGGHQIDSVIFGQYTTKETYEYDYSSKNDDTTLINSYFETPDFIINEEEYLINKTRFGGIHLEAKGNTANDTMTMEYSTDGGVTWSTAVEKTLTAVYAMYVWHFQTTTRRIRFRFANAKADEGFVFRFYGLEYDVTERRG